MNGNEQYMLRCIDLAKLAAGNVAPNPMVGAVLVYNDRIIGEGCHQRYGEAHAEVNCVNSVKAENRHLIDQSSLYVSLEPCSHFGKTPPCTDLIIRNKIPHVVIGCLDPFTEVNGTGVKRLQEAGVKVEMGILENECKELNKRFFTFHTMHRPYVILKWARTANGYIGSGNTDRLMISNEYTNRLTHRWRSEEAAILVGTNTALHDDPELTTRLWEGHSPIRMVIDLPLRLPSSLKLFDEKQKTIVFNTVKHEESDNIIFYQLSEGANLVNQVMNALFQMEIQSLVVEGGATLLQSFIDDGAWDEARVITNTDLYTNSGLPSPLLSKFSKYSEISLASDKIETFIPVKQ
jgi:diaminohydroxyphosphoribosylaminopyrimidine deaminase/5-amino-6-(5-phosphoribosylamino)uracil reductase